MNRRWSILPLMILIPGLGGILFLRQKLHDEASAQKCSTAIPYDKIRQKHAADRHQKIKDHIKYLRPNVVFIGDSITERWETEGQDSWNSLLAPLGAFNAGIDSDRTENVIWRIVDGALKGAAPPKICILLIGINNLGGDSDSPSGIAKGIETLATTVHLQGPQTQIIIIGLLPCGEYSYGRFGRRSRTNLRLANLKLPNTRFIDFSNEFINGRGGIKPEFTTDSLHLSEKGYKRLAKLLVPVLQAELYSADR
ncbi:MAG: GDSL-type esterase/lipase family protein [Luteolibacter sp.]